jgi:hypothetical protein
MPNPRTNIDPSDIASVISNGATCTNNITAFAGGGQTSATQMSSARNRVTTVATTGDSVKLVAAKAGNVVCVFNKGANSLNVFPATGDIINALSANAAYALAATKGADFYCVVDGTWDTILTA